MTEPQDHRSARSARRGRLRASHADREQVIDTLKDAFVQERLTKDEFDERAGYALAARTHADLAALIADLPAEPPAIRPPRQPVAARPKRPKKPQNTVVRNGTRLIAAATVPAAGVWAAALLTPAENPALIMLFWIVSYLWLGTVILTGSVMLESRRQQRTGGQLPPAPGGRGQVAERAIHADPPGPVRPGDHAQRHAAEASRRPAPRRSLLPEPRLNPS